MAPLFRELEQRVNGAVARHFANATATYTPGVGEPVEFPIIFDQARGLIDEATGVQTEAPMFDVQPADFEALEEGMRLSIRGVSYQVRTVLPLEDGGLNRVTLARV